MWLCEGVGALAPASAQCEFTPCTHTGTPVPQHEDAKHAAGEQTTHHTDPAADAQVDVEWVRKDDGPRGQRRAAEIVGGEQARGVLRICQGQVHEDALEPRDAHEGRSVSSDSVEMKDTRKRVT